MKAKLHFMKLPIALLLTISVNAQEIEKTIHDVNNTLNTAEKAKQTFDKINPFKKNNKKAKSSDSLKLNKISTDSTAINADIKTVITLKGIDFGKLQRIDENIKACEAVKKTVKKFSTNVSSIEAVHTGSTDDLLMEILAVCKDFFSDKNVENLEEGKISILIPK